MFLSILTKWGAAPSACCAHTELDIIVFQTESGSGSEERAFNQPARDVKSINKHFPRAPPFTSPPSSARCCSLLSFLYSSLCLSLTPVFPSPPSALTPPTTPVHTECESATSKVTKSPPPGSLILGAGGKLTNSSGARPHLVAAAQTVSWLQQ